MITVYQANKIYSLVRDRYFNILNDELLFITEGKEFCFIEDTLGYVIHITNTYEEYKVINMIEDKGIKSEYCMMDGINEVIALLHEIGHFYDRVYSGFINQEGYKEYKDKVYMSLNQAHRSYRNIPAENYADMFAVNFINEYGRYIWKIMNPNMTLEEIDKWIDVFK